MFYKALGFLFWKVVTTYLRQRYGRAARIAALVGIASALAAGSYLATRSSSET